MMTKRILLKGHVSFAYSDESFRVLDEAARKAGSAIDNVKTEELAKGYEAQIAFASESELLGFVARHERELSRYEYDIAE